MKIHLQKIITTILILVSFSLKTNAQCSTTVSTFPYVEDFETSNGGWSSGGTNNDWAWGIPTKSYITTAGSGVRCWVTGGLTGSLYNNCERSYVTSPCFDFTNVTYPYVQMKIFWESEYQYDGTVFQYSLNGGTTWTNVGSSTDPVNCLNSNWFNYNNITHLGSGGGGCAGSTVLATTKEGWCGNHLTTSGGCQGGNGSLGWVTAKHCMSNLAGQASVQFRFAFGAGSSCNAFDGFAFDSVSIGEAPANLANYTYQCTGANTVAFTNNSILCPNAYTWNFGDPSSGANNTSTVANPTHTFSAAGVYNVTLTSNGPCNASSTITKVVKLMTISAIATNSTCAVTNSGTISTSVTNPSLPITYTLLPVNTSNTVGYFNNLSSANYTITAVDAFNCSATTNAIIAQITSITPQILSTSTNSLCAGNTSGFIKVSASGGTAPFNYTLQPSNNTNTTGNFTNLTVNNYTIVVTDANGCSSSITHNITQSSGINIQNVTIKDIACFGQSNGQISTNINGGTAPYTYTLQPTNTSNSNGIFNNLPANTYTIVISDANQCTKSTSTILTQPTAIQIDSSNKKDIECSGQTNGSLYVKASGGSGSLSYTLMPTNTIQNNGTFNNLAQANYQVVIKDANNCSTITIIPINFLDNPINLTINHTNISCSGNNNDASATVTVSGGTSPFTFLWNGNSNLNTATINNLTAGQYEVSINDVNNCSASDTVTITDGNCCETIFIPNSFTPNGDNINDVYGLKSSVNINIQEFVIFNRFGQQVWEGKDQNAQWNGTFHGRDCEVGTYFYYLKYYCMTNNKTYVFKGDIELIK